MNYVSKVEYTLNFIMGEVLDLPEDFELVITKGEQEDLVISANDGNFIKLNINTVEASESDAQYYDELRDFIKTYVIENDLNEEPVAQDSN